MPLKRHYLKSRLIGSAMLAGSLVIGLSAQAGASTPFSTTKQLTTAIASGLKLKQLPHLAVPLGDILKVEFPNTRNCLLDPTE
ncbi:MAG: hypothetical protein WCL38_04450 [Actinomycetota bacterium]